MPPRKRASGRLVPVVELPAASTSATHPLSSYPPSKMMSVFAVPHLFDMIVSNMTMEDLAGLATVNRAVFALTATRLYSSIVIDTSSSAPKELPYPLNKFLYSTGRRSTRSKPLPGVLWARQAAFDSIRTVISKLDEYGCHNDCASLRGRVQVNLPSGSTAVKIDVLDLEWGTRRLGDICVCPELWDPQIIIMRAHHGYISQFCNNDRTTWNADNRVIHVVMQPADLWWPMHLTIPDFNGSPTVILHLWTGRHQSSERTLECLAETMARHHLAKFIVVGFDRLSDTCTSGSSALEALKAARSTLSKYRSRYEDLDETIFEPEVSFITREAFCTGTYGGTHIVRKIGGF